MSLIRPIAGLCPAPGRADDVAAPPYDVLNRAEAKQRADGKPHSFLHISKAEIDLPDDVDAYDPAVYAKAAENLHALVEQGVLQRDPKPCYYAYRLIMNGQAQTGLVAGASVNAYERDAIRKHEFTRPAKEDDRVRQIEALNAQTGPVFLVHRADDEIRRLVREAMAHDPMTDVMADDGVQHTLWRIDDDAAITAITAAFDRLGVLYVADGHHRSAAGTRIAQSRRVVEPDAGPDASFEAFLSVVFPHDEMRILDYNRVIRDLHGLSPDDFLAQIASRCDCQAVDAAYAPPGPARFGMYLAGQWYALTIAADSIPDDPVGRLDVSLLHGQLIEPVLGISDPRRDDRIDFVGGIRGLGELERRVDSGEMAVAFSLFATSLEDLMAVADAGEVMPPKSTWFEPKLADGLVTHVLD